MIYLTSDWHLYHDNIMGYVKTRGPHRAIDDYMRDLIYRMRSLQSQDTLILMGDLALSPRKSKLGIKAILDTIPCKKHFIRGNHDDWVSEQDLLDMGFLSVRDYILYKPNTQNTQNTQNTTKVDNAKLDCEFENRTNRTNTLICHYPFGRPKPKPQPGFTYELHNYLWDLFWRDPNIKTIYHGHIHAGECKKEDGIKRINCSVDAVKGEFRVVPITGEFGKKLELFVNTGKGEEFESR